MAKRKKKNKKYLYWLLMMVLFVAAAVIVYLVWNAYFKEKDEGQNSGAMTEVVEIEKKEEPKKQEESEVIEKPKVVQYDGEDPNDSNELSGVVTYAGVSGDNLMIRVNIDQYLENGECKLSLFNDGGLVHEEVVEMANGASTTSCAGFDVPISVIGNGRFDIVVDLESGGKMGAIREVVEI